MEINIVPLLADAMKTYYEDKELVDLCELIKFARLLITEIEHDNRRRFLESLVPSLLNRAREGAAQSKWDQQEFHRKMVSNIELIESSLNNEKLPEEISVQEKKPFTAKSEAREFLSKAETTVSIVDNYIGLGTLDCLRNIQQPIRLLTGKQNNSIENGFARGLKELISEGFQIAVKQHPKLHDRYILFNDRCWLVGSSLKDAGKKIFNIIECVDIKENIVNDVEKKWNEASQYIT